MPKCTINGQTVEVPQGATIIEAFKKLDTDIAHYCWHPGLTVAGVCRLCMVDIEGMPKLQIACNTEVKDGMVISNQSEKVKEAVRWGMDFHLINHPLDCPICDQAGECGLQEQYMRYGQYDPEMAEPKVKKRKVVDLGPTVVLDTERCILCSRCVRFTEEVSKTNELRIVNRGDHSEIGTYENKPLDNNYSVNTVDICPVGALTSKDFRFRQRVWYLKDAETICTGCSTGCNVKVYYNEEGAFRVKPVENADVNGYWMCDKGRDVYSFVNRKYRLVKARQGRKDQWQQLTPAVAAKEFGPAFIQAVKASPDSVALVVTGQYTNEEYQALFDFMVRDHGLKNVYHWINNPNDMKNFDGILYRGDRNANTTGLQKKLQDVGVKKDWSELESRLMSGAVQLLIVLGPENPSVFPDLEQKIQAFGKAQRLVFMTPAKIETLDEVNTETLQLPLKVYFEKSGTFVNHAGREQKIKRAATFVPEALTVQEVVTLMAGKSLDAPARPGREIHVKDNFLSQERGRL
jgi:NADH-quinone oxidoreductase subunit G